MFLYKIQNMAKRTILLIGARTGIGRATCERLLNEEANIIVAGRQNDPWFSENGIQFVDFDATSDELPTNNLPDELNGLVYFPGSINLKPLRGLKEEDLLDDFRLNALGAFKTIKATQSALKKGSGSIVLFSTVAVQQGMPFHTSVAAAKGAIEGMTRSLAAEFAPSIRVNAIAPSLVATPLAGQILSNEKRIEASNDRHPLKRVGRPEDIANMVLYLLSDASSWVSGQIMSVDGGMSTLRV